MSMLEHGGMSEWVYWNMGKWVSGCLRDSTYVHCFVITAVNFSC